MLEEFYLEKGASIHLKLQLVTSFYYLQAVFGENIFTQLIF
jgi:hypothetical protein